MLEPRASRDCFPINLHTEFNTMSGVLLALLLVACAILLFDRVVLREKRNVSAAEDQAAPEPAVVGYARSLLPVLLVVFLFRSFLFEPFRIPSASMMPGLVEGDFILVNKFTYGLRVPLINTKMLPIGEPRRSDVVVFRSPSQPSVNLIKRLIGLPGDHITVKDNQVIINGVVIPQSPAGNYQDDYGFAGAPLEKERMGVADHLIMLAPMRMATDFDGIVPPDHYFFMGDNRNDSADSRFPDVGFVSEDNLIGHAIGIWMNWRIPGWPRLERVGLKIR
jgi:signal peptidase I